MEQEKNLLITTLRGRVLPQATLGAMLAGFLLSVVFYSLPETKGGVVERCIPFAVSGAIAWLGSSKHSYAGIDKNRVGNDNSDSVV